jgi:hypothetical protein
LLKVHGPGKKCPCPICGKVMADSATVTRHIKVTNYNYVLQPIVTECCTGFPRYLRMLRSSSILIREYQNLYPCLTFLLLFTVPPPSPSFPRIVKILLTNPSNNEGLYTLYLNESVLFRL